MGWNIMYVNGCLVWKNCATLNKHIKKMEYRIGKYLKQTRRILHELP